MHLMAPNIHGIPPFLSSVKISVAKTKLTGAGEFQPVKYFPLT